MTEKILIIDDDAELCKLLKTSLSRPDSEIHTALDWRNGLHLAYELHPDLIILDIMMPEMDGFDVCKRIREMSDVPILMLTAKSTRTDLLKGFQSGADDYVYKPYDLEELKARVDALLKRRRSHKSNWRDIYDDGNLQVDLNRGEVYKAGERIHLSSTEFQLLKYLIERAGVICTHRELVNSVWGSGYMNLESEGKANLSLYIRYLREKIESDVSSPRYIRTEWGTGYWFSPDENARK